MYAPQLVVEELQRMAKELSAAARRQEEVARNNQFVFSKVGANRFAIGCCAMAAIFALGSILVFAASPALGFLGFLLAAGSAAGGIMTSVAASKREDIRLAATAYVRAVHVMRKELNQHYSAVLAEMHRVERGIRTEDSQIQFNSPNT